MFEFPSPHGDKLHSLLRNKKLPVEDRPLVENAINYYETRLHNIQNMQGTYQEIISRMVQFLNDYKLFLDVDLIFDSNKDFLYRQKGQIKLDNSIVEEFLSILVIKTLSPLFQNKDVSVGPTASFSGIRFESGVADKSIGGGMQLREKDQDFAIARKLFIRTSHQADFEESTTKETNIVYVAAECKTNLDKTMFQEASATALDVKTVVPGAKYYLLCEWLDMLPINTKTTAIDEIIILRKSKRLTANIRREFDTIEGRKRYRSFFVKYLQEHPFSEDMFSRFLDHIRALLNENKENDILMKGYF